MVILIITLAEKQNFTPNIIQHFSKVHDKRHTEFVNAMQTKNEAENTLYPVNNERFEINLTSKG